MEIWKNINRFEGKYIISSEGRVFSLRKNKYLNPCTSIYGYFLIKLGQKSYQLHKLLACHFLSNPESKRTVNHKDGNKLNNRVDNLEWATDSENIKHAFAVGLKTHKGENNPTAKLSNSQAQEIRDLYKSGNHKQIDLANLFSVSQTRISAIIQNQAY